MDTMLNDFKNDMDELLHGAPYINVDILPLVEKYTVGKNLNEKSRIKITIQGLIHQYKEAGLIDGSDDFHAQLAWQPPTDGYYVEEPILIRSTIKFEDEYIKKHTAPVVPQYFEIKDSPHAIIGGRDVTIRDNKSNEENLESKELAKEQLKDIRPNKWYRKWQFILAGVVIIIMLLTWLLPTCNKS